VEVEVSVAVCSVEVECSVDPLEVVSVEVHTTIVIIMLVDATTTNIAMAV